MGIPILNLLDEKTGAALAYNLDVSIAAGRLYRDEIALHHRSSIDQLAIKQVVTDVIGCDNHDSLSGQLRGWNDNVISRNAGGGNTRRIEFRGEYEK